MQISNRAKIYISLTLAMLFWSMSYIWYKQVYHFFQPVTTVFFRLIISSLFMFILIILLGKKQKIDPGDYKLFLLSAFFEPFLYFLGESMGIKLVSPTLAALIIATIPLFAPMAGILLLGERLSWLNIVGIFISVAGVTLVIIENHQAQGSSLPGILFMFLAVFSAVGYSMVIKTLTGKYKPLFIVCVQNSIGIIYFLPLFLIFDFGDLLSQGFPVNSLLPLIKLSVFASAFAYILFTYGISQVGIAKASVFSNFIPVFTALFSWYFLNEYLGVLKVTGIIIVISGLFFSQITFKKRRNKNKANHHVSI